MATQTPQSLRNLLNQKQTGLVELDENDIPKNVEVEAEPSLIESLQQLPSTRQQLQRWRPSAGGIQEDYTEEALQAGFGNSRYDTSYYPGMDIENSRALSQSGFAKIGTGLVKGGVTAATTALNTTVGTVVGALTGVGSLGEGLMGAVDAGVNNPVSEWLIDVQRKSEEWFPNYRTSEERSEKYQKEWYKHMLTANFIGDSLLKNFGFTVGAIGGGMVWSKALGAMMSKSLASNIMKGTAAAAVGDAEAEAAMKGAVQLLTQRKEALLAAGKTVGAAGADAAISALESGNAVGINAERLIANVKKAAQSINKMDAKMQLFGSVLGAMGEGTTEGLMAKAEFNDELLPMLQQRYAKEYEGLEQRILDSGNKDWVEYSPVTLSDGSIMMAPKLTDKGQMHLRNLQLRKSDEYADLMDRMDEEGERLASTTFLLNLPILTTSNLVQFGRMFSGGWKTTRAKYSGIEGSTKTAAKNAAEKVSGYARPLLEADYTYAGKVAPKALWNTLKVMGSESFEEMAQGTVSSGAKRVGEKRISSFNDDGYNPEAVGEFREWFSSMYEGGKEYLSDIKNWQEGALGALTGMFGIPGRRWNGGIFGAIRDAKEEVNDANTAAQTLSRLVNSKEFQDRWHGYIRHQKYDADMQNALAKDDEYAWHTADDNMLISDVIAFADAGKLDDLDQIIKAYGNLSESEAEKLRDDMLREKDNSSFDWAKNKSGAEIASKVKDQANKIQKTVNEYKEIYDALSARAPIGAKPEFIKEQVFTAMQIKAMDTRFLQMFGETMDALDPLLIAMGATSENGETLPAKEAGERYKSLRANFEQIFAGQLLPSMDIHQMMKDAADFSFIDSITKNQDPELNKKINDMKRLADDRNMFFLKLQTLQKPDAQKKFDDNAVTQEKIEDAAEKDIANIETSGLKTIADVRRAYFFDGDTPRGLQSRLDFVKSLRSVESTNPAVKEFLKMRARVQELENYANNNLSAVLDGINDATVRPVMVINAIRGLLDTADNEQEILDAADKLFESEDDFIANNSNSVSFGGLSFGPRRGTPDAPGTYQKVKSVVRSLIASYIAQESGTVSRKTMTPEPNPATPAPAGTAQTEGSYDPAAPGSQLPPPAPIAPKEQPDAPVKQEPEPEEPEVPIAEKPKEEKPVPEDKLTRGDIAELYEFGARDTEEAGREGFAEVVQALRDANPNVSGERSDEEQKKATENLTAIAQKYPELELSKRVLGTYEPVSASEEAVDTDAPILREFTEEEVEEQGQDELPDKFEEGDIDDEVFEVSQAEREEDEKEKDSYIETRTQGDKIPYYRTSIPEIATGEARKARNGHARAADLSDFVTFKRAENGEWVPEKNANYAKLYRSLQEVGAFDTVATELERGDRIEFVVSPDDKWKLGNTPQILVTTVKDGKRKVLTILSQQTDDYYNLAELRNAIMSEYQEFAQTHPNEEFVFSKKSEVWTKRSGVMDYGPQSEEKGIEDISGYDENAPIIFIEPRANRKDKAGNTIQKGTARIVRGSDKNAVQKTLGGIKNSSENGERLGRLYYLAKNGDDSYIPVRLNVEHFNHKTKNLDNPTFKRIRDIAGEIAALVHSTYVRHGEDGKVTESNIDEQNKKLSGLMQELNGLLDLRGNTYAEIRDFKGIGPALRFIPDMQKNESKRTELLRRPDQLSANWMVNAFADLDRSINIHADKDGKIAHLDDYIKQGIITSNARKLRAKGADFYMLPWRTDLNDFGPATVEQYRESSAQAEARGEETGDFQTPSDVRGEAGSWFGEEDDVDEEPGDDIEDDFVPDLDEEPVEIDKDTDYQQEARSEYLRMVRESLNGTELQMNSVTPVQLARHIITLASQGSTRLARVIKRLSEDPAKSTTKDRIDRFSDIMNMVLSKEEREDTGKMLAAYQKVDSPENVDMYKLLIDYNDWRFNTRVIENEDVVSLFRVVEQVENNSGIILNYLPTIASRIGYTDDDYASAVSDFGMTPDISKFENLPEKIQAVLKDTGKDTDYDSITPQERDKRLSCLGY